MSHPDSAFFIPRVKGQCEELVKNLRFPKLVIYRPGLLRCDRHEVRILELAARKVSNLIDRWNWWSVASDDLAKVIISSAKRSVRETATPADGVDQTSSTTILEHYQIIDILNQILNVP